MKALERLLKKYEIQLMNLKENKILSLPEDEYPYNFDINRTKGFVSDLKRVLANIVSDESNTDSEDLSKLTLHDVMQRSELVCTCSNQKIIHTVYPLPDICDYCRKVVVKTCA